MNKVLQAAPTRINKYRTNNILSCITYPIIRVSFNKNLARFFYFCLLFHVFTLLFQVYYILKNDKSPTSRHLTAMAVLCFLISTTGVYIFVQKPGKYFYSKIQSIHVTQQNLEGVGKFIKSERKSYNFLVVFTLAAWASVCFVFTPIIRLESFFLCFEVFNHYFGYWSFPFKLTFLVALYGMGYASATMTFYLVLMLKASRVQFCSINERFKNMVSNPKPNQNEIYGHICSYVKEYLAVYDLTKVFMDEILFKIECVLIPFGALCFFSIFFQCLQFLKDGDFLMFTPIFVTLIYAALVLWIISVCSQQLTDESGRLVEVPVFCPWLHWNTKNRRALLLMLTMSTRPLGVTFVIIKVNYRMAMQFMKIWFSYALALYQVNS